MPAPKNNQYAKGHGYGRPAKYTCPDQLNKQITAYFTHIDNSYEIPTISGLTLYLGFTSRQSLYDYKRKEDFSYSIKRALLVIECYWELQLSNPSKGIQRAAIWMLKNFGWKENVLKQ